MLEKFAEILEVENDGDHKYDSGMVLYYSFVGMPHLYLFRKPDTTLILRETV